jgi:hypothetical protein
LSSDVLDHHHGALQRQEPAESKTNPSIGH